MLYHWLYPLADQAARSWQADAQPRHPAAPGQLDAAVGREEHKRVTVGLRAEVLDMELVGVRATGAPGRGHDRVTLLNRALLAESLHQGRTVAHANQLDAVRARAEAADDELDLELRSHGMDPVEDPEVRARVDEPRSARKEEERIKVLRGQLDRIARE